MDIHFSNSDLMKTPSPDSFYQDYEYPIQHVSMAQVNSFRFHELSPMRADWGTPVPIRSVTNMHPEILQPQPAFIKTSTSPEVQRLHEPNNSQLLKLCLFQGEVSQTRVQRAEIIIPSVNGTITQPVVILPLKRKETFVKKPIANFEAVVQGKVIHPAFDVSLSDEPQNKYPAEKMPMTKQVKLERESADQFERDQDSPQIVFSRAPTSVKNEPTKKNNKRLCKISPKQPKKRAKVDKANRFENPKPIIHMPSLSPNTFWQSQPRLPQWLTGLEYVEINNLPEPLNH